MDVLGDEEKDLSLVVAGLKEEIESLTIRRDALVKTIKIEHGGLNKLRGRMVESQGELSKIKKETKRLTRGLTALPEVGPSGEPPPRDRRGDRDMDGRVMRDDVTVYWNERLKTAYVKLYGGSNVCRIIYEGNLSVATSIARNYNELKGREGPHDAYAIDSKKEIWKA